MSFSENIKSLRKKNGLTQKQLADNCGLSIATIQGYEQGKYEPKPEAILKLVNALNTTPSELMGYSLEFVQPKNNLTETLKYAIYAQDIETGTIDNLKNIASGAVAAGKEVMKDINEVLVISEFRQLNDTGQKKAIEQVEILTKIPEYRKDTEESDQ